MELGDQAAWHLPVAQEVHLDKASLIDVRASYVPTSQTLQVSVPIAAAYVPAAHARQDEMEADPVAPVPGALPTSHLRLGISCAVRDCGLRSCV